MNYGEYESMVPDGIGEIVEVSTHKPDYHLTCARVVNVRKKAEWKWINQYETIDNDGSFFVPCDKCIEYEGDCVYLKPGQKFYRNIDYKSNWCRGFCEIISVHYRFDSWGDGFIGYQIYYRVISVEKQNLSEWEVLYGQEDHSVATGSVQ